MARARMVSKSIARDKALNSLSIEAALLFLMAIPHLDRDGLLAGDFDLLHAIVAPRRPELLAVSEAAIQAWITVGLVVAYEWRDGRVLFFPGFDKNNTLHYDHETPSEFPPPPGYHRTDAGLVRDDEASDVPAPATSIVAPALPGSETEVAAPPKSESMEVLPDARLTPAKRPPNAGAAPPVKLKFNGKQNEKLKPSQSSSAREGSGGNGHQPAGAVVLHAPRAKRGISKKPRTDSGASPGPPSSFDAERQAAEELVRMFAPGFGGLEKFVAGHNPRLVGLWAIHLGDMSLAEMDRVDNPAGLLRSQVELGWFPEHTGAHGERWQEAVRLAEDHLGVAF